MRRLDLRSILELGELMMGGAREWVHLEVNAARAAAPDGPSVGPDLIINHLILNTCKYSSLQIRCIYFGIVGQCCCSRDVNHLDSSGHVGRLCFRRELP